MAVMAFMLCVNAMADDWMTLLRTRMDSEDESLTDWETIVDHLTDLENNPLNINMATREDLESLGFLTDAQIEAICHYLYNYHPMRSAAELKAITELNPEDVELLKTFIIFDEVEKKRDISIKRLFGGGKHQAVVSGNIPLYDRAGDENGYLGYKYKHTLRYDYSTRYLRMGITGSQDAGEPFLAPPNQLGYDYYSYYFLLKNVGPIRTLALGKYKVSLGMGLTINNNFGMGKTMVMQALGREGIRACSSRSEADYLNGAALSIDITDNLYATAFVSHRYIDATLNDDGTIATILQDGYHRTQTEIDKKDNARETTIGAALKAYIAKRWKIGINAVTTHLSRTLNPKTSTLYRRYYAHGNNIANYSLDYAYTSPNIKISGETASGTCGNIATINAVRWQPTAAFDLTAMHRFYSYRYYSLHAKSMAEGGMVQNESGATLAFSWRPSWHVTMTGYSDYAYFPWAKYQAALASQSWDNMLQMAYSAQPWRWGLSYRLKLREKDDKNSEHKALVTTTSHKVKAYVERSFATRWLASIHAAFSSSQYMDNSMGYMLSANIKYDAPKCLMAANIGYFDTDDYDSRIYAYEPAMRYAFSFPTYYGQGIRYSFMARYHLTKSMMLAAKMGVTDYFDRTTIGSGLQQIKASSKADIELQLLINLKTS